MMSSETDRAAQEAILELERRFGEAMIRDGADAIGRLLSDDWIVIDPDGGVIDRLRFLPVLKWGALRHEVLDSEDIRLLIYPTTATGTAVTHTTPTESWNEFTTH